MMISVVVAADERQGIGIHNKLPWKLRSDLQYFRNLTTGHHIIMGRNTYESIGKPLPNRVNIVLSSQKDFNPEQVIVRSSLHDAIEFARDAGETECMVIGGAALYNQILPFADRIYLTRVHANCTCDVFFPEMAHDEWKLISSEKHPKDDNNEYSYSFEVYDHIMVNT